MSNLRRSGYGELVATAFVVIGCFHLVLVLVAAVGAVAAPQFFSVNGQPAENTAQAFMALGVIVVVVLLFDALACAVGAAVWMLLRLPFRDRARS